MPDITRNIYAYDVTEFARLLGIPDDRTIVTVKFDQGGKIRVWLSPE